MTKSRRSQNKQNKFKNKKSFGRLKQSVLDKRMQLTDFLDSFAQVSPDSKYSTTPYLLVNIRFLKERLLEVVLK